MCKKRCKKRPAPQAAHGAQQQHRTKTRKRSSCAPKQSRDGASCIEALDPQSTAAAIQAACAERDLVRKRALLEQLVEACSSFVTSAPMSQVAADELYAQRADLGPNPSKGRALGQEEVKSGWARKPQPLRRLGADGGRVAPTSLTRRGMRKLRLDRQFCYETLGGGEGHAGTHVAIEPAIILKFLTVEGRRGWLC